MKVLKVYIFAILSLTIPVAAFSQPVDTKLETMTREEIMQMSQDDLLELSIEDLTFLAQKLGVSIDELLKMKTSVASKTALTTRETPGIISMVTEEEIRYSGARDMIDVLRLIPGFDFGYDVQGVVGVGLRGNWVHEGKILILVDGQQMNELSYYNFAFGNHIPVDQIKRIEIIRGPGSAIYGGIAELGVINIITKAGKGLNGMELSATYGQMQKSMGRANINLNGGMAVKKWDLSAKGFLGVANRSDQVYNETLYETDDPVDLSKGGSEIKTKHFNIGATNNNLSFRLIYDDYKTRYGSYIDSLVGNVDIYNEFRSILGEVNYNLKLNEKLTITPKFNYKYSRPYYEKDYWRNFYLNRYVGNITLNYQVSQNTSFATGFEFLNDQGFCIEDSGIFYANNTGKITLNNSSFFAEGTFKLAKVHLIAGGRIENNSEYGWAFAPRIGITGVFNSFHFKTLFSGAFRSPGIGNIDVGQNIGPEKSFVSEIELGYRINNNLFITTNLYDIRINNTIIYFDDGGSLAGVNWGYMNADKSGSNGVEAEIRAKYTKGYAIINYSYYTLANRPVPESYAVPGNNKPAVGLSQHKIGFSGNFMPTENFSINPSLSLLGKKYAYDHLNEEGNPEVSGFGPYCLLNFAITYSNILAKGLSLSLSGYDLLNQAPPFLQPYNGWYAPYPGRSREILMKITFNTAALYSHSLKNP